MSDVQEATSNENSPEYNRARRATIACWQLVLVNMGLIRNGLPGKLYIDMKDSSEYIEYNQFIHDLHTTGIIDLLHLEPYLVLPNRGNNK